MSSIDVLKKLEKFGKSYFTTADLRKILATGGEGFNTMVKRLTDKGVLERLNKGIYRLTTSPWQPDKIANQLYYPSYLSFVSALSRYGIIGQIPYSLTFATIKKSKKIILGEREVVYSQLQPSLFFGYKMEGGINIAYPEKALLDQVYLTSLGKSFLDYEELTLIDLNKKRFDEYLKRFPRRIYQGVKEIKKRWGQVFVGVK